MSRLPRTPSHPRHHDHDAPPVSRVAELADVVFTEPVQPAVRVPIESHVFRQDLHTLFHVDTDNLSDLQWDGYDYAAQSAWERMERLLPLSQVTSLANARDCYFARWSTSQFSRALMYFTVGEITGDY